MIRLPAKGDVDVDVDVVASVNVDVIDIVVGKCYGGDGDAGDLF